MHGLELFDIESIKNEYNLLDNRLKDMATDELERITNHINSSVTISHKKMLELVRDGVR
jgi:hypothetical protein